jgi:hypothetical protein
VILAERECKRKGFKCTAVPTPREYTAQCGIALEVPEEQKEEVVKLINQLGKPYWYYDKKNHSGKS